MKHTGNTIFITGGGSGIGRALAEASQKAGNTVIISGRRKDKLDEVTAANPGMHSIVLDVESPESIASVAKELIAKFPALNVVINNAGIMSMDGVDKPVDDKQVTSIVTTNLLGPIRITSAFIEHLKAQPGAAIAYVTSGLAFTPLAPTATYNATKAAIHSYALSQRYLLAGTNVKVIEIAPPYVQTELMGDHQKSDPRAMPLDEYIAETMKLLGEGHDEILVERVLPLRNNAGPNEHAFVKQFNDMMSGH
ncbi:SDR family oxidoreductase [Granulicella cerasi]|uniref:SDR family oxidoreductase n=1 Tax=Granulicella cerasi TaxID=741063 RepID=A0ABW1Z8B7_9BACT|nr:SDR family NAD(P)-dependent oxidoreductase [Granulicella cerasi]